MGSPLLPGCNDAQMDETRLTCQGFTVGTQTEPTERMGCPNTQDTSIAQRVYVNSLTLDLSLIIISFLDLG